MHNFKWSALLLAFFVWFSGASAQENDVAKAPQETAAEETSPAEEHEPFSYWSVGGKIGNALLFYIPNRIMDLFDCFSLEVGYGADVKCNACITRFCGLGFGAGPTCMLGWDYNRQFGIYQEHDSYDLQFLMVGIEDTNRVKTYGTYKNFLTKRDRLVPYRDLIYQTKLRDLWAIELEAGLLLNAKAQVHPVGILDFIAGFFFIDLEDDDVHKLNEL